MRISKFRHVYGQALQDGLTAGLALLRKHHACKWLSDDRNNGPISPKDAEWLSKVWEPQAIAAGWRFWALVQPMKVLGEMNMRRHVARIAGLGVTLRVFEEVPLAEAWLDAQRDG